MNLADKTFSELYESYLSRYTCGCFVHGDIVKFTKGIEKEPAFKTLPPDLAAKLLDMANASLSGDAVIAVRGVSLSPMVEDNAVPDTITLAYSMGGGRYIEPITIPGTLANHLVREEGASMIPKSAIADYTVDDYYTASEVDLNELEKSRMNGYVKSVIFPKP